MKEYLFLPLKKEFFDCFRDGSKQYELRGINKIFNSKTVHEYRMVRLSLGYSNKTTMDGIITRVAYYQNIEQIKSDQIFDKLIPPKIRNTETCKFLTEYLKKYDNFIVFKIDIPDFATNPPKKITIPHNLYIH